MNKAINFKKLHELSGGKTQTAIEFIELYLSRSTETIAEMNQHLTSKDWDALEIAAHNLRTNSRYMGVDKLSILAKDIEEFDCNTRDLNTLATLINKATDIFMSIVPSLQTEKKRLAAL